jgi:hypothetical protein
VIKLEENVHTCINWWLDLIANIYEKTITCKGDVFGIIYNSGIPNMKFNKVPNDGVLSNVKLGHFPMTRPKNA